MLLIIAPPILPVVAEQDGVGIHVSGCEHQGVRQSASDGNAGSTCGLHRCGHANVDRRVGSVEDGDVPSVIVRDRIRFLVLDHVHRAPARSKRGLDAGGEDGFGVGLLAAYFGVEDAGEFGGDTAAAAGGAEGILRQNLGAVVCVGFGDLALEGISPVVGVWVASGSVGAIPRAGDAEPAVIGIPVVEPDVFVAEIGFLDSGIDCVSVYTTVGG